MYELKLRLDTLGNMISCGIVNIIIGMHLWDF